MPPIGGASASPAGPVRFGSGTTLTVSPLGTATGGTIYLRGRGGHQAAVRVFGATGRVRVLTFEAGAGEWVGR